MEISKNASSPIVIKFPNTYICNHGVTRAIKYDQARCLTGKIFEDFC